MLGDSTLPEFQRSYNRKLRRALPSNDLVFQPTSGEAANSEMKTEIDRIPVGQLIDKYKIKKSALYDRLYASGIKPERTRLGSFVSADQLDILDKLDEHLKNGGALADFAGLLSEHVDNVEKRDSDRGLQTSGTVPSFPYPIVIQLLPSPDPLANYRLLDEAAEKGWALPTSTLLSLLGRKSLPQLTDGWFCRFGFMFLQTGRAGREAAWKVRKNQ